MSDRSIIIYSYDGSFDGLLCCVYESYDKKEIPADVLVQTDSLPMLLPVKFISTDEAKAARVRRSVPEKMGRDALEFIQHAFLTYLESKSLHILRFLRLGYRFGKKVMNMLTNDTVYALSTAVRHLEREAHLYKGFVRFSQSGGVLTAQIEPKNIVLPLIARHFCERFPEERFLIHDKTHDMALLHEPNGWIIAGVEQMELPKPDEEELRFRALWQLFYRTIEIKERHNPRCRMSFMPKRYWSCLTEFANLESGKLLIQEKNV